jgi:endoglucanase
MEDTSFEFLKRLLDAPGPSGFETAAARVWRAEAEAFARDVTIDVAGNSYATVGRGGGPVIMLAGHVDEIGLMVTHVDEEGFLYVDGIGGWDPQVLVGQRIRFLTNKGDVVGVVGKKPIHLIKPEEKEKAVKISDLWVDVGARGRDDAVARGVRVGDPGIVDAGLVELGGGLIASRAVDNRIGAYVVLEVLRALSADEGMGAEVTAVATAQEEIGYHGGGARTSAYKLDPRIAIAVDLTFSTDAPGVEKKQVGEHKLGSGPVLSRGSAIHPIVFERLAAIAEAEGIPYTIQGSPRMTSTDADAIYLQRAGVPTAVVSVPNRYMHSPNEVVDLADVDATVRLIGAFCRSVAADDDFIPR